MSKSVEQVAFNYLFCNYGELILADDPIFDVQQQVYVSNLRSDYPLIFQDDRTLENRFHLLKIPHIGSIVIDKDFKVVRDRTTSRNDCIDNLRLSFDLWLKKAEEIIVLATAESLVAVSKFNHYFDTMDSILGSIYDHGCLEKDEIEDGRHSKRLKKTYMYLQLLEGLELIRRVENGFVPGNVFAAMTQKCSEKSKDEFLDILLSYIIRERYPTLRDVFKLTILEPTIHVDSCIYLPELEEGRPIQRTEISIQREYKQYYNRSIGILDLRLHLRRLERANAIKRDGDCYFGVQTKLEEMLIMKKKMPPITSLLTNP